MTCDDPRHDQLSARVRDLTARNAQLRGELDRYRGHQVFHCLDRDLEGLTADPGNFRDASPGAVLRATDTGREVQLAADGQWVPCG